MRAAIKVTTLNQNYVKENPVHSRNFAPKNV